MATPNVNTELERMESAIAQAADDSPTRRARLRRYLRVLSRPARVKAMRAALSAIDLLAPGNEDELTRYLGAGFNTVVVEDRRYNGTGYDELSEADVKARIDSARARNLSILISCYADAGHDLPALTADEVSSRMALWASYDEGDVIGVFFVGDDTFLTKTTWAQQAVWRNALREVTTAFPVFGMIGEFAVNASSGDQTSIFSARAFDHLLFIMYPYNLGEHWSTADATGILHNHDIGNTTADPDLQLREYIETYIETLNNLYFSQLGKSQVIVPVVQGFNYMGEPAPKLLRTNDVSIQMEYGSEVLREFVPTQADNYSMTVFWWGGMAGLFGLRDNPALAEAARRANTLQKSLAHANAPLVLTMLREVATIGGL